MAWPLLPLDGWQATYDTLHRWMQIVGKTRLALAPMQNHWWQVVLYVTSRGLGTSPMPFGGGTLEVDFDFLDHQLVVRTSRGATVSMPLVARSVAEFHREYLDILRWLEVDARIWPVPVEMPDTLRFTDDHEHASYDPDAAYRCWQVLLATDRVLESFRGRFLGKCSPSHFWWGAFDIACTRFSGKRAPEHPGGVPNLSDRVTREAYSHECISAGWWPGGGLAPVREPAFYAYVYPEPPGCPDAAVEPPGATWHLTLHEWILPYETVRTSGDPEGTLMRFLQSTYEAAAGLAGWDRAILDRA